ncbi:MAG: Transcriptional regulator containing HTH domain, ArsR family [Candidatus Methanohalarchaeum thermophilum]|uniref:Transcriptional regulator containing HTH domain, ArsR family n=1 Tax=Methanohalarchaeum thermophilum TaxID=1903181 RepID=A0A1Q6DWU1_METT1|nr:MAG: Transcriptional regulator containing HTH domain, ArsR family [Candidatus Methanohalarchaeum thermophilum]
MEKAREEEIELLKCVGNEIRYRILRLLEENEKYVTEIIESLNEEQTLISHHLWRLHKCGLVEKEKKGRKSYYKITDPSVHEFIEKVKELSQKNC